MQFAALRYFHEAARAGSIRQAAERLHVAPSAISRQLLKLEHDVGAPLFERGSQGVRLTLAGKLLASHTQKMFRELARVRSSIDDIRGLRRGEVVIYAMEGLVAHFLPNLVAEFHDTYPEIQFVIHTAPTDRIVEALIADEADIGITFNAPDRSELVPVAEYIEPLDCIVSPHHALAHRQSVSLEELATYHLALPENSFGLRQLVDRAIHGRRLAVKLLLNTNSLELTKTLAATGRAVAFMPALTVEKELRSGTLVALTVDEPEFRTAGAAVCIHRNRSLPVAVTAFLDALTHRLGELDARATAGLTSAPQQDRVAKSATPLGRD